MMVLGVNQDNIELSTPNGASVNVTANTASTSTTTGAMVVTGGAGIGGALHAGGEITAVQPTCLLTNVTDFFADENDNDVAISFDNNNYKCWLYCKW